MKFYLNKSDLETIIRNYKNENTKFQFKSLVGNDTKKRCTFFINGLKCEIDLFLKKDGTINPTVVGDRNINECNLLIYYIMSKGLDANKETYQFTFNLSKESLNTLISIVNHEYVNTISIEQKNDIYKFIGYNGDWINLTYYPTKDKAMIQGKALYTYCIISNIIVDFNEVSLDDIISINNNFVNINTPFETIRTEMKQKLGDSYSYLDDALLKSISGSVSMLKSNNVCEDYTGYVAGMFKGLEGYLKKVLTKKYSIKFSGDRKFSMFHKDNDSQTEIDKSSAIPNNAKRELNKLYSIYKNKRNILLHTTIDPSQTKIVETINEAKEIAEEIFESIKNSYSIFF